MSELIPNVSVQKEANIYFEGKVISTSISFPNGSKKTLGVMLTGEYEFNTEQKEIMNNLLESVQTGALRKQFEKYIPSVLNGRTPAKKQAINEGTEVTGDKQINIVNGSQFNSNIVDIRRLAGI